jgi:hypothetical protein
MAWRLYLKSGGKYNAIPSQQIAMSCGDGGATLGTCKDGGENYDVFEAMSNSFLPAALVSPYVERVTTEEQDNFCRKPKPTDAVLASVRNSIGYTTMKNVGDNERRPTLTKTFGEVAMMKEIFENGPAGMAAQWNRPITTYPNNDQVCRGIQTDRKCSAGDKATDGSLGPDGKSCVYRKANPAVAVIGWGVDDDGCPDQGLPGPIKYWIIQNSHGAGVGDCETVGCGFYRIERGVNAFAIETKYGIETAVPDVANMACSQITDPSQFCQNGGAFATDCSCICPAGFGGPTCGDCSTGSKSCTNDAGTVVSPIFTKADAMKGIVASCKCPCGVGYWSPPNLRSLVVDCAFAVGFWTGNPTGPASRTLLSDTVRAYAVASASVNATIHWRFIKDWNKPNSYKPPFINKGDFVVAVPTGSQPWTPQTKWDGKVAQANICGEKETKENQLVGCSSDTGWPSERWISSMGTLVVSTPGIYDVYFVKYNGVSEFGVDKGFGKDFAQLPQRIQVLAGAPQGC